MLGSEWGDEEELVSAAPTLEAAAAAELLAGDPVPCGTSSDGCGGKGWEGRGEEQRASLEAAVALPHAGSSWPAAEAEMLLSAAARPGLHPPGPLSCL